MTFGPCTSPLYKENAYFSTNVMKMNGPPRTACFAKAILNYKELAMQNSHCNNGSLGLTYLTTLPRPNDLQIFFTKSGTKFCEKKFKVIMSQ